MIRSFVDAETEKFFTTGKSRRLPPDIQKRAAMRLRQLHAATRIEDMRLPPSNKLRGLEGRRKGQPGVWINDQWRLCFRFAEGDAFEVESEDYHRG
jgi:toxin HigB-1